MPQLTPIQLDDGTIIYIEATENVAVSPTQETDSNPESDEEQEVTRGGQKGWVQDQLNRPRGTSPVDPQAAAAQSFKAIEGTICAYTTYTLSAFQQIAVANIDKVTLGLALK